MRSMHKLLALAVVVLSAGAASGAAAQARTFQIDDTGGSHIQFVSDAPLEKITGVTSRVSGNIVVDPGKPADGKADVKVDIASIKTGIDLRDEHLRAENWLDAKRYPHAQFAITKITGIEALKPNEAADVLITGIFSLHGVSKEVTTKARVRWIPASPENQQNKVMGDALRVQASFVVKLEDHKVSIPSIVSLKVARDVQVNVDLRATSTTQAVTASK